MTNIRWGLSFLGFNEF